MHIGLESLGMKLIFFAGGVSPEGRPSGPKNPDILVPLARLIQPGPREDVYEEQVRAFAAAWTQNPQGAICTLQSVVDKAETHLKEPLDPTARKPKYRRDAAFVAGKLRRFLGFFQRECWDTTFPGRIIREFSPQVSRNEEGARSAYQKSLPAGKGAWHEFIRFIQSHAPVELIRAIQQFAPAESKIPEPQPPSSPYEKESEDTEGGWLSRWERFRPSDDDFID